MIYYAFMSLLIIQGVNFMLSLSAQFRGILWYIT